MAIVFSKFVLTLSYIDNGGNKGQTSYDMQSADHATALLDAVQVATRFASVSRAEILSYHVSDKFINDAPAIPTDAAAQIEVRAQCTLESNTDPTKKFNLYIPAPEAIVFMGTSGDAANIVDVAGTEVLLWVNSFSPGGELYISDGEQCKDDGILKGKRTTRRSNRG